MSTCEGKIRFPSFQKAQKRADKMERNGRGYARAYRCDACDGYHMTSEPHGVSWRDKYLLVMGKRP